MREISQLCAVLCLLLGVWETEANCFYEQCVCEATYTICTDRESDSPYRPVLPIDLDKALEVKNGMLPPNLTEITLRDSPIQIIGDRAFDDSATTLKEFTLSNSIITKIPDAFLNLKILQDLAISDTTILNWNEEAMTNVAHTLQSVTLSNVGLTSWPSWLANFSQLTDLTIEYSSISLIPDGVFDSISTKLISLSLNNNKLTSVPKALSNFSNLENLYLQENFISNVTWIPPSKMMYSLMLSANKITDSQDLSNVLAPFADSLSIIDLNDNRMTSIPRLDFLTNVGRLDLSNNRLSDLISGSLPAGLYELDLGNNLFPYIPIAVAAVESLNSIDLQFNSILEIRGTDFSHTVTQLGLDNNQLTELSKGSFPLNSSLVSLGLNYNPIASISPTAFQNLLKLSNLRLVNSHLTRLPLALASLKSLSFLDLTSSSALLCTCEEKSLGAWIMKLDPETVQGNCGLTSINTFFYTLSPSCPD